MIIPEIRDNVPKMAYETLFYYLFLLFFPPFYLFFFFFLFFPIAFLFQTNSQSLKCTVTRVQQFLHAGIDNEEKLLRPLSRMRLRVAATNSIESLPTRCSYETDETKFLETVT